MRPAIKGWCPGALRPMESGDGWVVRLRPLGGRLTREQATRIAELSSSHGNGLIDLSGRANLQIRGVSEASHPDLIAGLAAVGLIDESPAMETARNIIVQPFWTAGDGTQAIASALARALPEAPPLPGKFGYAIDTGPVPVLRDVSADIRVERDETGLILRADGSPLGRRVTPETVIGGIIDLARWFVESGGIADGRGRMAPLIARGVRLPSAFDIIAARFEPVAFRPGLRSQGALVGFEFGQMQADTLRALANLGPLRITPWRMILIEGAREMPDLPGLITRGDDPLSRVVACAGRPACGQAHQPTRPLARALANLIPDATLLHLSGCAKGCAHPGPAALTLVATPAGFDLISDGRASDRPTERGLTAETLATRSEFSR